MDIIAKDKKDIQWKGFPPLVGEGGERASGASAGRDKEKARLKSKIDQKSKDLKDKEDQLKELVNQFVSLKQLLVRNAKPEYSDTADQLHRIYLPFVIGPRTHFCAQCFCVCASCRACELPCVVNVVEVWRRHIEMQDSKEVQVPRTLAGVDACNAALDAVKCGRVRNPSCDRARTIQSFLGIRTSASRARGLNHEIANETRELNRISETEHGMVMQKLTAGLMVV